VEKIRRLEFLDPQRNKPFTEGLPCFGSFLEADPCYYSLSPSMTRKTFFDFIQVVISATSHRVQGEIKAGKETACRL
jgi:hypothetical protein